MSDGVRFVRVLLDEYRLVADVVEMYTRRR